MAKNKVTNDKMIAMGLAGDSVAAANSISAAISATSNPDLKRLFKDYYQDTTTSLEAVQTFVADKGWAKPYDPPEQQLQMALQDADSIISLKA